jgi:hypothetical protein
MVCRYPRLQRDVAEKNIRSLIFAAHRSALSTGGLMHRITEQQNHTFTQKSSNKSTFSAAC